MLHEACLLITWKIIEVLVKLFEKMETLEGSMYNVKQPSNLWFTQQRYAYVYAHGEWNGDLLVFSNILTKKLPHSYKMCELLSNFYVYIIATSTKY
jgi:hypothetical protein